MLKETLEPKAVEPKVPELDAVTAWALVDEPGMVGDCNPERIVGTARGMLTELLDEGVGSTLVSELENGACRVPDNEFREAILEVAELARLPEVWTVTDPDEDPLTS